MAIKAIQKFLQHHTAFCTVHLASGDGHCSCGRDKAQVEYDLLLQSQLLLDAHPRAAKLMLKGKNFLVVADDEPYFPIVYSMIREQEKKNGRWTPEDEQAYLEALKKW